MNIIDALILAQLLIAAWLLLFAGVSAVFSIVLKVYGTDIDQGDNLIEAAKIEERWFVMSRPTLPYRGPDNEG